MPESHVQTRLTLLTVLREFEALGGGKIKCRFTTPNRSAEEADPR